MTAGRILTAAAAGLALAGPATAAPGTAAGQGLFDVSSAFTPPRGTWSASLSGTAYRIEERRDPEGAGNRDAVAGGLHLSYGAAEWLEVFGRIDAAFLTNDVTSFTSPRDGTAGAKIALPFGTRWLHAALEGQVSVPWGKRARGFSSSSWDPAARLALTVPIPDSNPFSSMWLHFNVGYRARGDDRGSGYEGKPLYYLEPNYPAAHGDQFDLRGALHFRDRRVELFAELLLDAIRNDNIAWGEGPLFVTPGFRFVLSERWSLLGASKITLASDDESTVAFRAPEEFFPDWQIGFALTWSTAGTRRDRDGDGVADYKDRCPHEAEDRDGVADYDGCPEWDADGDGLPDDQDGCPEEAEDYDGNQDFDGCPEPDPEPAEEEAPDVKTDVRTKEPVYGDDPRLLPPADTDPAPAPADPGED